MSRATNVTDKWINIKEAAELLTTQGVPTYRSTVENWVDQGYLEFIQMPSGRRRVRQSDIEAIVTPKRLARAS